MVGFSFLKLNIPKGIWSIIPCWSCIWRVLKISRNLSIWQKMSTTKSLTVMTKRCPFPFKSPSSTVAKSLLRSALHCRDWSLLLPECGFYHQGKQVICSTNSWPGQKHVGTNQKAKRDWPERCEEWGLCSIMGLVENMDPMSAMCFQARAELHSDLPQL